MLNNNIPFPYSMHGVKGFAYFVCLCLCLSACRKGDDIPHLPTDPVPETNLNGYWNVTENVSIAFNSSFKSSSSFVGQTIGIDDSNFIAVQKRNAAIYPWAGFSADSLYFKLTPKDSLYNSAQGNVGISSHKFDTLDYTYAYGLGAVVYFVTQHWVKNPALTQDSMIKSSPRYDHPFLNDSVSSILIGSYGRVSNVADTGKLLWTTLIETGVGAPPVPLYENENVYVSNGGALQAIDYVTGNKKWYKTQADSYGFSSYISLYGNSLYAIKYALNSYDKNNGNLLTSDSVKYFGITGPYLKNQNIFFGDYAYIVYSFNCTTRTINWQYKYFNLLTQGKIVRALPVVANDMAYFAAEDGTVFALDANTGAFKWKTDVGDIKNSNPVVKNGILYIGSDDYNMYAIDAGNGSLLWKYETGYKVESTAFVANGVVYFGSQDKNVYALNARTGEKIWEYITYNPIVNGSPAVVNNVLYIGSGRELYAVDCSNGKGIWIFTVGDASTSPCIITKSKRPISAFTER